MCSLLAIPHVVLKELAPFSTSACAIPWRVYKDEVSRRRAYTIEIERLGSALWRNHTV